MKNLNPVIKLIIINVFYKNTENIKVLKFVLEFLLFENY